MHAPESLLSLLVAGCPMGITVWVSGGAGPEDLVLFHANAQASEALGLDLEAQLGARLPEILPSAMVGAPGRRPCDPIWLAASEGIGAATEFPHPSADGGWRWLRSYYVPLGAGRAAVYYHMDANSSSSTVIDTTGIGVVIHNADTSIAEANQRARQLLGLRDFEGQIAADPVWVLLDEDLARLPEERYPVMRALAGIVVRQQLLAVQSPDGQLRWLEANAIPRTDPTGAVRDVLVTFLDVTEREVQRRQAEVLSAGLHSLSITDPLTQCLNRRGIMHEAERLRSWSVRHGQPLSLFVADLDGLKTINDTQGHAQGDLSLIKAAKCLDEGSRGEDVLGRLGGDEFVILFPGTELPDAAQVMARIQESAMEQGVSISAGGAQLAAPDSVADLIARADRALYRAKAAGGNTLVSAN